VADVLAHCHIDLPDSDTLAYLSGLIAKATRTIGRMLDRQFVTATWKLYLDDFPDEIELTKLPVASVTSITYVSTSGTTTTLPANQYQTSSACPDCPGRISPAYGCAWPSVRGGFEQVVVTFTAGYGAAAAVPQAAKHALLLIVAHWYENREPTTDAIANELPFCLAYLLSGEDWGQYT
jgi:uncharacterized phiE125 gp8 family phage protein